MNGVSTQIVTPVRPLAGLLRETSFSWSPDGSGWRADMETVSIRAEGDGNKAVFSTELARWDALAAPARRALEAFLDELNGRWQPARGLLFDDKVEVQVVVSAEQWSPEEIGGAVEALLFAHRRARKEFIALLHEQVAQLYLQFHEGEKTHDGDHDD